jgi:uncharacterized protein with von Willebrand factor type A (vWA) domain
MADPGHAQAEVLSGRLIALADAMRARGARVGVGEVLGAHRALAAVNVTDPVDARCALRCVLCSNRGEFESFEAAFEEVFGTASLLSRLGEPDPEPDGKPAQPRVVLPGAPEQPAERLERRPTPAAWSEVELLLDKDLSELTPDEAAVAQELMQRLARRAPVRRSRRTKPSHRRTGHELDLRALLRDSMRTGGEPFRRTWRGPTLRPRPVVLVCDVSGSMTPYARMLLQYLHACVAARRRVEAFAFGTRLTRITHELGNRDHDRALERASEALVDLAGGTRIGQALGVLNREHGRRVGRGAIIVILSDGWDRGDPELLEAEMARLRRTAHRLVWLNPLAGHPGYEPLTRGMQAAVPHVDRLLPANSVRSLQELAARLEEL